MGLRNLVAQVAVRRAHVLVVEAPGGFLARVALERALGARGWVAAQSPPEAEVLAVCGEPSPDLAERIEAVFDQLPGPRARVEVTSADDVDGALDTARTRLLDLPAQGADARARVPADQRETGHEGMSHDEDDGEGGGEEADGDDHGDHGDHGGMDHGDHGGMDHGDMEMAPAGIPLAEGAEDRDGLEMDVLHLPLGPVLPHWPPGLVVRCTLHGDVVADVEAEWLGEPATVHREPSTEAARRLDAVVGVLALSGWDHGAGSARRVRDLCLDADPSAAAEVARLRRRVARSAVLRWMLRGIAPLDPTALPAALRATLAGDVHDRLLGLVDGAAGLLDGTAAGGSSYDARELLPDLLPDLLSGLELASVRLAVTSVSPFLAGVEEVARA